MSDDDKDSIQRLQAIMTALLQQQLESSLAAVEQAITKWRAESLNVFEAHAALLKHAARAERLAERMSRVGLSNASSLMRDAYDAGLVSRSEFFELVGRDPDSVSPSTEEDGAGGAAALPCKRDLVEDLLGAGPVLIHVDARSSEVSVPEQFRSDPKLVLRFGYGLTPAIIDLGIDESAISGTLTFSGVPHRCVLPWSAVYAVVSEVDQKGMVWPDDVPHSVVEELTGDCPEAAADDGSESDMSQSSTARADSSRPKARGSHLKIVK